MDMVVIALVKQILAYSVSAAREAFRSTTTKASTSAAVDDRDLPGWLKVAMDVPVTASLGPMGPLICQLYGRPMVPQQGLPMVISTEIQQLVDQDLIEGLFITLKDLAEMEDTSFMDKWWMKEVRELCYDTQDHFDEVTMQSVAGITSRIHLWVSTKLKQQQPLIASDILEIMTRVEAASERLKTFEPVPTTAGTGPDSRTPFSIRADTGGRSWCRPMDDLIKLLAFDDESQKQLKVVSIFGSAGVGKTTAARTLYDKFGRDFQCRAFLWVSRNPDVRTLLTSIHSQIKAPEIIDFPDVQFLTTSIREHLQDKRYFIVIDDLWNTSAWDIINRAFPDGYCSRVITTTQVKDVSMAGCSYHLTYRYELRPLNDDQSGNLFFIRAFGSEDRCPQYFRDGSYEIIRKCGGLPLAIVIIASLLSSSQEDQLKVMQYSLSSALKTNPTSDWMKEILNLVYNNLSPHLKTCFLYLSMYPEGYIIRKDELVKQWVAEGFIGARHDTDQIARGYFDDLVSRGLIQPVYWNYNDEVLSCTVHHLVLDFIRYKSIEENFIISVDNLRATPGLADKVRRLSVQFGGSKTAEMPESMIISQARSLSFCGFLKLVPSIVDYRFLRVLILRIWADYDKASFDLTGINELLLLRYLKIECNITVELPAKIRGLQHLGTLEVDARLSTVPSDIGRVQSLLHLRLPSDSVLDLDNPTNLQDLHLTCCAGPPHRVVRNMKHLGSILGKCDSLQSLILDNATSSTTIISCDGLSRVSPAPARLQRLELLPRAFIFPSLPKWLKHTSSLCILKIAVKELPQEDMNILKGLPALAALSLSVGITPADRIVIDEGFTVLRYFKFTCAALCLVFLEGAIPKVQRLKLRFNINTLEKYDPVHAGFRHLSGLKEISAKIGCIGTDESDKKASLMDVFRYHPSKPILNLQLVDRIIQDHRDKLGDLRVSMGREELSSHPQVQGGEKRWSPLIRHLVMTSAETLRGTIYHPLSVSQQLESIQQEMRLITVIIEENKENDLEERWVPELQNLVYDIEDYICIYNLLRTRQPVCFIAHVRQMKLLEVRINNIRKWKNTDKPSKMTSTIPTAKPDPSLYGTGRPHGLDDELVGIVEAKKELLGLLFQDEAMSTSVISIVGFTGLGKSSLAAIVCNDYNILHENFINSVWVKASECSNVRDVVNEIFNQLGTGTQYNMETEGQYYMHNMADNIKALTNILNHHRYLVVIDDMQRADVWHDILHAFLKYGLHSKIIVTTSIQSVATAATSILGSSSHVYKMRGLGDADSKHLFWRNVCGHHTPPPTMLDGLQSIFKKCDGLPLALVSTANYLSRHHRGGRIGWFDIQEACVEMNRTFGHCYNSLPDNGHKKCLLSLSIFPQGHQINRKSLIRRWIAEGLVDGIPGRTDEEVAAARFGALIDRNIIEPFLICNSPKDKRYRVNGAMLEFILKKAISVNFAALIRKDEPVSNRYRHPVRRLSVHGDTENGSVATEIELSVIRSLTIIKGRLFDLQRCKLLRVLDLERCKGLDDTVLGVVCQLLILKYLSLRGSDVRRIPKRIRRLRHLETLDMRETEVANLPVEVLILPCLIHLFGRFELPQELRYETEKRKLEKILSEKSKLQTLSGFVMEKDSGFESIVLHMRFIRKVKIWFKRYSSAKEYDVSSFRKLFSGSSNALESVSIDSDSYPREFLHSLQAPCKIKSIKLRGNLPRLPEFLSSSHTLLSELELSCTGLSCEDLSVLQDLQYLLYLNLSEVRQGFIGGIFQVQRDGFPSLERLCLEAPMLPEVHIEQGAMPYLTSLRLLCLPQYAGWRNVKGIEHLQRLKEVVLHHSVDAVALEAWKQTAMMHKNRPKVSTEAIQSKIPW